nr:hypothetical protein [Flavobacterium sp. ASV13]
MSLENHSKTLKELVSKFDTQWFLGHISGLIINIVSGLAQSEIRALSSPQRQLYYLGGLLVTSSDENIELYAIDADNEAIWDDIVTLLNEIEQEYGKIFHPAEKDKVDADWLKMRSVAMPSFLSYFNQGPLNYEEQKLNWIKDLYVDFDEQIYSQFGLKTADFITFYNTLDYLIQDKFQAFTGNHDKFKAEWMELTNRKVMISEDIPSFLLQEQEKNLPLYQYVQDQGIMFRFHETDLISEELPIEKIEKLLAIFTCKREETDFIYYSSTRPANPLYMEPIIRIENFYQVFEVKQVLHSIEAFLEKFCSSPQKVQTKLIERKGKLLEKRIAHLFEKLLKSNFEKFESYFVDGKEQDLLYLWKKNAFIIEAKGYNIREPLREPSKAYARLRDDFNSSIGYGYEQTFRIESKFFNGEDLIITDDKGVVIKTINTSEYEENDFSIIINLNSFGQIQNDLSILLTKDEDDVFPWVVKLDDFEVIVLTLLKLKKGPDYLIEYLLFRETLHGRVICGDELELFGAFIQNLIPKEVIDSDKVLVTNPMHAAIFDDLYYKGLGFRDEKYWAEKKSGKYRFI